MSSGRPSVVSAESSQRWTRVVGAARIGVALVARPNLWAAAWSVVRSHSTKGWWRRGPFVPRPARAYLAFRVETQYGDQRSLTSADPEDVMKYLVWVKNWGRHR